jgi:hypothetical protein
VKSFVAITIIECIITLGIMNQLETIICIFEEKITNPEIKETVYINPFVVVGDILERHTERNINQYITNPVVVSEKVAIETIVTVVVMNKYLRLKTEFPYYMPVIWMVVVIFIISVGIRIVIFVIIYPAILVPAVTFPTSVPVVI